MSVDSRSTIVSEPELPAERASSDPGPGGWVRHYRQILLWPLQLVPSAGDEPHPRPWELLGAGWPWYEMFDEYTGDPESFGERHYNEFVSFLPYVQRFLYGEGRSRTAGEGVGSPMRVFRRDDIARVRIVVRPDVEAVPLEVKHVDLYFFRDLDVVMLNVEVFTNQPLPVSLVQELTYRFGRGYPGGWTADGRALNCLHDLQWLAADGRVLSASDTQQPELFMQHVATHRSPRIATHWAFVLEPMVFEHTEREGPLRYRQIDSYRMPVMAYLAIDDPKALTRADFVRLGLLAGTRGIDSGVPYGVTYLADFESRYCYDRFWIDAGPAPFTRYLCCGTGLVVVGNAASEFFRSSERGELGQFRHQTFLLFLIAHLQKAALLSFSDGLSRALRDLDTTSFSSIKRFKRRVRGMFARFLRFTDRYWFHEISEQAQLRALFRMCAGHLGLDELYREVRERIVDANSYLDADSLRRQANTVVRLTVVTMFGLIGTVTTGFLGMNLIAAAEEPMWWRIAFFVGVMALTIVLTFYTIAKSPRLSDFLDALSNERLSLRSKLRALAAVWIRE